MDPPAEASLPFRSSQLKCYNCGRNSSLKLTSQEDLSWIRSVKRKYDEVQAANKFHIPGLEIPDVARVEVENECHALRTSVNNKQILIDELSLELDEERSASSTAANEAMSMILRLQREKAEIEMEARQFKRFAEEKMSHDAEEVAAYEEMIYKRDQTIQSLTCEVQAYKHRMMSLGLTESEADGMVEAISGGQSYNEACDPVESPSCVYPPLKCVMNDMQPSEYDDDIVDINPFAETPRTPHHLKNLDFRINQLERSPRCYQIDGDCSGSKSILDKVTVGPSPRRARYPSRFNTDSPHASFPHGQEYGIDSPRLGATSFKKLDFMGDEPREFDDTSDIRDDMSDRVYTIDSIHHGPSYNNTTEPKCTPGICDEYVSTPRGSIYRGEVGDSDIKKLYLRLQALEADRESLRHTIISMQTDKAQLVLLREIAQHLCKDMSTERRAPVKKASFIRAFSFLAAFKWILSFIFRRKSSRQSKYTFGMSKNNVGLLCLLDRGSLPQNWRCLTSTQVRKRNA